MSISQVSSWGVHGTTLDIDPVNEGDLLIIFCGAADTGLTCSAVSELNGGPNYWWGVVTTTGAGTVTVSSSMAVLCVELSGAESGWSIDGEITKDGAFGIGTWNMPSLSPSGGDELYFGIGTGSKKVAAGDTTGFTYTVANLIAPDIVIAVNTDASSPNAYAPNWVIPTAPTGQGGSGFAALFVAS